MALSTITDAYNALGRLTEVFEAEERQGTYSLDLNSKYAIEVKDADFQWEGASPESLAAAAALDAKLKAKSAKGGPAAKKAEKKNGKTVAPVTTTATPPIEPEVLQLSGINLKIPRGQLCAIVGAVGAGKSSLLQALVGEMKRNKGEVIFGGSISYVAQQAWIQNATVKVSFSFDDILVSPICSLTYLSSFT